MIENVFDWFNVVGDILSSGLGSICFNFCMVWCGFVDIWMIWGIHSRLLIVFSLNVFIIKFYFEFIIYLNTYSRKYIYIYIERERDSEDLNESLWLIE